MGSWFLEAGVFENLLRSCIKNRIEVSRIVYLGLGEPLEHPSFSTFCELAAAITPDAIQELGTNGNHPFRDTVRQARLDRIIVAGDGARRSSYVKYRVRGSLDSALQFMRDARQFATNKPFIEWKYILFEFNDSDEEIIEAQHMAEEIGVDSIMFIVTPSKFHSKRYRSDNLNEFPCVSPIATVSPAAGLQKVLFVGDVDSASAVMGRRPGATCFIDSCVVLTCGVLRVEGWALARNGSYAERVELLLGGKRLCVGRTRHSRKDVPLVIENAEGAACGFVFQYPFDADWLRRSEEGDQLDLEILVYTGDIIERFYGAYSFPRIDFSYSELGNQQDSKGITHSAGSLVVIE